MKATLLTFLFSFVMLSLARAQFAPQAGIAGSTAIHKSSPLFKAWASECTIRRGLQNIADPSSGYAIVGDSATALGIADGEVVSLGDSGVATIQFAQALYNGDGADFAVFENGFQNPANAEEAFLELAFVEVSSDGEHFFRFPATSNTPHTVQIKGAGDYMNARLMDNLAGKYIAQNGTPFDLDLLKGISGLDINNVTHVRIVDVIGAIANHSSFDHLAQVVNDPYPTPYPTSGFDLDAVGAIHLKGTGIEEQHISDAQIFPNPASSELFVALPYTRDLDAMICISDMTGKVLLQQIAVTQNYFSLSTFQSGLYLITIRDQKTTRCLGKFSKI